MDVFAEINAIKYKPLLCKNLEEVPYKNFSSTLDKKANFILNIDKTNKLAISWWVSAKRTRSYPYTRVYDTLGFSGKKLTIIPLMKDEGKDGDRDFLQWDTISLMSLLGVYTIISYYKTAEPSKRYKHKITHQRFDIQHIEMEIANLLSCQSDALHWNLEQADKAGEIGEKSLSSYARISKKLGIEMHSSKTAKTRINQLLEGKMAFMELSRKLASDAQTRESITIQPKEKLSGDKATITIKNYLGGYYFFTCDEAQIKGDKLYLAECKHSKNSMIPSSEDIKDGLIKMILFVNLSDLVVGKKKYIPFPVLKLTSDINFSKTSLQKSQFEHLRLLNREAEENGFNVLINNKNLSEVIL